MLPCQASLRRAVARRVVIPSPSDSVKMDALARRMHSFSQVFFFGSMAKFLQIFPMLVSGSGPIGSGLIVSGSGRGTQSTACSGFHESGRTGGKSPGCILTVVIFFFKLCNYEQLSRLCVLVSTSVAEQLACSHVYLDT
jgi:hypothetical protein